MQGNTYQYVLQTSVWIKKLISWNINTYFTHWDTRFKTHTGQTMELKVNQNQSVMACIMVPRGAYKL